MGIMERFGRIADTYISEKEQLLGVEEERRRVHTGHAFWPTYSLSGFKELRSRTEVIEWV